MKLAREELPESQIGGSAEAFRRSLEFQRDLFHSQVDQLRTIVVAQCKLTGVNPLSQEMAAGALSVKIGKRPRDLLNPKAVKYMQSVFSIKDAVSKKECREIGALFGLTVTQVREYFASQRTRVRKIVRLSRENATERLGYRDEIPMITDSLAEFNPVPLNMIEPSSGEQTPSCSPEENVLSGVADLDKQFVERIFNLMRKEETFSGQVKLMEWILQIENPAVLCWFLSKGGTMILATWLSQAATEEQTSVLLIILQVLCHLPLSKALPLHMSAILQSVNRLRFYKTSDISNRARVLLSKWSRSLARSQGLKNPKGANSSIDEQQQLILKQSLNDVIGDESWQSSIDTSENIYDASDGFRKCEPTHVLRLMPASVEDSVKKNNFGISTQIRERRKVQLVEQPGQKSAGRSPQATKTSISNQSRPMSADDIQKAKIRAQFMQSKYRKHIEIIENEKTKTENIPSKPSTSQVGILPTEPKITVLPHEQNRASTVPIKVSNGTESPLAMKPRIELNESLWEKCRRVQISWKIPPEVELKQSWRVGAGESSKEADAQRNRNRREKETVYHKIQDIPLNPKDPWDSEIDYDDTLTPVIPEEQVPEVECPESPGAFNHNVNTDQTENGSVSASQGGNPSAAATEPDLELLAVLLKNPELVFALTSGQASNLSSSDTVKLLDMIKAGAVSKPAEEMVEVSLPSPTPPSNPGTSGWRPEAVRNPFSQIHRPAAEISATAAVTSSVHLGPTQPAIAQYSSPQAVHKNYSPMGHLTSVQQNSLLSSANIIKPAHASSTINSYNSEESQRYRNTTPYLPRPGYSNDVGKPSSEFWRAGQNLPPNYNHHSALTQTTSYSSTAHVAGPHWEGNEYAEREDFESWGSYNRPGNFAGPRPEETSFRESGYREHNSCNRHGNRRWRDRRR